MIELAPMPHGPTAIKKFYSVKSITPEGIVTSPPNWESDNIVSVTLPAPMPTYDNAKTTRIRIHKNLSVSLGAIMAQIQRNHPDSYKLLFFSGSFNPRAKRGQDGAFSLHSVGAAVDFNDSLFPFRSGHTYYESDMPLWFRAVINVFNAYGWEWGGIFGDSMHFQYATGY